MQGEGDLWGGIAIIVNCAGFGISGAVELGDTHTGFTQARQKVAYIARIAQKKSCAPICVAGAQYKFLSLLCKLLPCTLRGKIVGAIYAK